MPEPAKYQKVKTASNVDALPYANANKIPIIMGSYDKAAMRKLQDLFLKELNLTVATEMNYCLSNPQAEQRMDNKQYNYVCDLLCQCETPYELDAFYGMIFKQNYMPASIEEVRSKGRQLAIMHPVLNVMRGQTKI